MPNATPEQDIPRPDGLQLWPFRGTRFASERVDVGRAMAPPYDVIDAAARQRLLDQEPHNIVRLTLPEGEDEAKYDAAAQLLASWRAEQVLRTEQQPALYVYEQATPGHAQRGLLGALALTPAEDGIVLPHENTMAGPVADRLALTTATAANLEPIFLVYDGGGAATDAVAGVDGSEPVTDVMDPAGVRHRLWPLTDADLLAAVARDLEPRRAVIADGHHRYATYLAYQRDRHAAGHGRGPWDRGLAFLVDAARFGPEVHPIHRVVPGLDLGSAVERAKAAFQVRDVDSSTELAGAAAEGPAFAVTDGDRMVLLERPDPAAVDRAMPEGRSEAWRALHVSVAHHLLFRTLWGLDDREGVVDFEHDEPAAVAAARAGRGVAVLLAPTPVADVAAVAAAGDRMPRKSTLFVPKPATGMVLRILAGDRVAG